MIPEPAWPVSPIAHVLRHVATQTLRIASNPLLRRSAPDRCACRWTGYQLITGAFGPLVPSWPSRLAAYRFRRLTSYGPPSAWCLSEMIYATILPARAQVIEEVCKFMSALAHVPKYLSKTSAA